MTEKPPLSKKKKNIRWVLVAAMGIITTLETIFVINLSATEGCGAIGAGLIIILSLPIAIVLVIVLFIIWLILGRRKIKDIEVELNQNS